MADHDDRHDFLLQEIVKIRGQMLALQIYVASIPHYPPLQAISRALDNAKKEAVPIPADLSVGAPDLAAAAKEALNYLEELRGQFFPPRR